MSKRFRGILYKGFMWHWSGRTAVMVAGIVAAVLLLGGGSYALFWGGGSGPAASVGSVNLSKGLVGHWKFDGNTNDSTPYKNNAVASGVAVVQEVEGSSNNTTQTLAATWSKATTAGNTLMAIISSNNGRTYTAPSGWSQVYYQSGQGGFLVYEIVNASSRSGTETFSFNLNEDSGLWLFELAGVNNTTPNDVYQVFSGSSSSNPTVGPATVGANAGIVFALASGADGTGSAGHITTSGWITDSEDRGGIGYRLVSGGETVSATFTGSASWKGSIFSLNAASPPGITATTDYMSQANQAYNFGGSSDMWLGPTPALNVSYITVSAWVRFTASNASQTAVSRFKSSPVTGDWLLETGANGTLSFYIQGVGSASTPSLDDHTGKWVLLTGTYDGTTITLYKNGQVVGSSTVNKGALPLSGVDLFTIGGRSDGSYDYMHGGLDDVRIYNRAISANEVKALYNSYNDPMNLANGEKGLVGWWKFDSSSLTDSTPNHIKCTNLYSGSGFTVDRFGHTNSALNPGGLGLDCGSPTALQLSSAISLSAWVKPTTYNSDGSGIVSYGGVYMFYFNTNGTLEFDIKDDSYGIHTVVSPTALAAGNWYLTTATFDGSIIKLYVNGSLVASTPYVGTIGTTLYSSGNFIAGGYNTNSTTSTFEGPVDNLRVYNRALSPGEITNLYSSYNSQLNLGGDGQSNGINLQKGLVGRWAFDGNVKDSTPYRTVCAPSTGSPSYTADRMGGANRAMSPPKLGFDCGQPTALRVANITMSAWINASSINSSGSGIESYGGTTQLYVSSSSNEVLFTVHDSLNQAHTFGSAATISTGQWYFVAVTYDGSTVNIYINGALDSSTSYTGGIGTNHYNDSGNDFELGEYSAPSTLRSFQGALDDVRLYNRALSANEIKALYNEYQ